MDQGSLVAQDDLARGGPSGVRSRGGRADRSPRDGGVAQRARGPSHRPLRGDRRGQCLHEWSRDEWDTRRRVALRDDPAIEVLPRGASLAQLHDDRRPGDLLALVVRGARARSRGDRGAPLVGP